MDSNKVDRTVSQNIFQVLTRTLLEGFKTGDIVRGRVQSIENGLLFIKLFDGTGFTARVSQNIAVEKDAFITLEIGKRVNDQLTARIIEIHPEEKPEGSEIFTTDKDIPLVPLKNNIIMEISSHGVNPTEKLISEVLELLNANSRLTVSEAVFIKLNNLESKPEVFKILNKIASDQFRLSDKLQELRDIIIYSLDQSKVESLIKPLLINNETNSFCKKLGFLLSDNSLIWFAPDKAQIENVGINLADAVIQNIQKEDNSNTLLNYNILNSVLFENSEMSGILKPNAIHLFIHKIKPVLENFERNISCILKADVKALKEYINIMFNKAFAEFNQGGTVNPDIREKEESIKEIISFASKFINQAAPETQERAISILEETIQAFRFFNEIILYNSVVHIPIRINQHDTTGELYIMKRKKGRKKIDPENFSLFISLETANLGRIESFISCGKKRVILSIKVEKEELIKLIKNKSRTLYDRLLEKGYKLVDLKCDVLNEKTGLLNADRNLKEITEHKNGVDIWV
jgi:hypothetical protein